MAAAEFERELIRERSVLGQKRYRSQYEAGKVGKEVHSKSGKDLPVGRPKRIFARQEVLELRGRGLSYRQIARQMEIGEGTVRRVLARLDLHGGAMTPREDLTRTQRNGTTL
jgi:putative DNA-invertase from lambdoid prophage Rac